MSLGGAFSWMSTKRQIDKTSPYKSKNPWINKSGSLFVKPLVLVFLHLGCCSAWATSVVLNRSEAETDLSEETNYRFMKKVRPLNNWSHHDSLGGLFCLTEQNKNNRQIIMKTKPFHFQTFTQWRKSGFYHSWWHLKNGERVFKKCSATQCFK